MRDTLAIGPLNIYVPYLMVAVVLLIGYGYIFLLLHTHNRKNKKILAGEWVQMMLLTILIWKFSNALFHPIQAINNPARILYLNGGTYGWVLGSVIAGLVFLKNGKHHHISIHAMSLITIAPTILAIGFYGLLKGWVVQYLPLTAIMLYSYLVFLSFVVLYKKVDHHWLTSLRILQWALIGTVLYFIALGQATWNFDALWIVAVLSISILIIDYKQAHQRK
ncbi:hypothetical protein [Thalassobacillus hwangdonensis]